MGLILLGDSFGGGAGLADQGGSGGASSGGVAGGDGTFGIGGDGGGGGVEAGGGGGGGGYFGGGGGGGHNYAGSGGGGSSFAVAGASIVSAASPTTDPASVQITYPLPTAHLSASALHFNPIARGTLSAAKILTVKNQGSASLIISGVLLGGADPDDYIVNDQLRGARGAGRELQDRRSLRTTGEGPAFGDAAVARQRDLARGRAVQFKRRPAPPQPAALTVPARPLTDPALRSAGGRLRAASQARADPCDGSVRSQAQPARTPRRRASP